MIQVNHFVMKKINTNFWHRVSREIIFNVASLWLVATLQTEKATVALNCPSQMHKRAPEAQGI